MAVDGKFILFLIALNKGTRKMKQVKRNEKKIPTPFEHLKYAAFEHFHSFCWSYFYSHLYELSVTQRLKSKKIRFKGSFRLAAFLKMQKYVVTVVSQRFEVLICSRG
jgi:hypothetical protein